MSKGSFEQEATKVLLGWPRCRVVSARTRVTTRNRKEEKSTKDVRKEGSPRLGDLVHDDAVVRKKVTPVGLF